MKILFFPESDVHFSSLLSLWWRAYLYDSLRFCFTVGCLSLYLCLCVFQCQLREPNTKLQYIDASTWIFKYSHRVYQNATIIPVRIALNFILWLHFQLRIEFIMFHPKNHHCHWNRHPTNPLNVQRAAYRCLPSFRNGDLHSLCPPRTT